MPDVPDPLAPPTDASPSAATERVTVPPTSDPLRDDRLRRRARWRTVIAFGGGLFVASCLDIYGAWLPRTAITGPYWIRPTHVAIAEPWPWTVLWWVVMGVLLVSVVDLLFRRRLLLAAVFVTLAAILQTITLVVWGLSGWGDWEAYERRTIDGAELAYLEAGRFMDQGIALAVVTDKNAWRTRYRVIGYTRGDHPREWLSVVRPTPIDDRLGGLTVSADGKTVVGTRYDNHAFFAYDVATGKFVGEDIVRLSPFLLLGPDEIPSDDDAQRVLARIRETKYPEGRPSRASLVAALDHPNPRVRVMAAQMVAAFDALPAATSGEPPVTHP